MKKNYFLMIAIIALIISGCSSNKQTTTQPAQPQDFAGFGKKIITPCVEKSMDDKDFYRGLGIGTDVNAGNARSAAIESAQAEIQAKLGGFIKGISSNYKRTMAGNTGEHTQRALEGELFKSVEKILNDAEKICDETTQDQRGAFNAFMVLQISKEQLIKSVENSLSANKELTIEFNRDQFRKFAEEKMKALDNSKNSH